MKKKIVLLTIPNTEKYLLKMEQIINFDFKNLQKLLRKAPDTKPSRSKDKRGYAIHYQVYGGRF